MKNSLPLTSGILGLAALAGWWQHQAATAAREERARLRGEVMRLGIDPDWLTKQPNSGKLADWQTLQVTAKADAAAARAAHETKIRGMARELIAIAKEEKEMEKSGKKSDVEAQKRSMVVFEQLMELKEADFDLLLDKVKQDGTLTKEIQTELIEMSVMMLSEENPRAALKVAIDNEDLLKKGPTMGFMAGLALGRLAETDPAAALAWMDEHKDSGFVTDMAREQVLAGMARADPERALRRMLEGEDDPDAAGDTFGSVLISGKLAQWADRDALLAALRKVTAEPPESGKNQVDQLRESVLSGIGAQLVEGGFETGAKWLESATLSPEEKTNVINGVSAGLYFTDPVPWLGWMQQNLPEESVKTQLPQIIRRWTERDYNAVGNWLNTQPAGPAKEAATLSFAETLIPHEPEAAQRWIDTLPAGEARDGLLKRLREGSNPETEDEEAPAMPGGE